MKFSCTQENLHQGLSIVSHIANKNVNLPILGNVHIKCDGNVLRFTATNLEIAVSCLIRGKVEENGEFTVPSKLFAEYVALLPKERVDVAREENDFTVSCGAYHTKLHGIVASEFPLIPTVEQKQKFVLKVAELRRALGQVAFAVAPNESRPEISGVLFKFVPRAQGGHLVLAATDSYRLAEKVVAVIGEKSTDIQDIVSVIVPARTVGELSRILSVFKDGIGNPEEIDVVISDNQILFLYNNAELISRTIEGKYPDYRQLIPERFTTEAVLQKEELLRAVKTTSLFSRFGLNDVHFKFSSAPEQSVQLTAANNQTGEHSVALPTTLTGKDNEVTVNFKYFVDGVNTFETDTVRMQLHDGVSPCILRPGGSGDQNVPGGYLYIVMPIRQ